MVRDEDRFFFLFFSASPMPSSARRVVFESPHVFDPYLAPRLDLARRAAKNSALLM
jgi:hypothetical protein